MKVKIKNKEVETQTQNLQVLLTEELRLSANGIAVAIDNKMIPRTQWESTVLLDKANIIIIKAVCGG